MTIRLPFVINKTPDSVQSKHSENEKDVKEYIWKFRNKSQLGIHVVLTPINCVKTDDIDWEIEIYTVEWTGNDYTIDNEPIRSIIPSKDKDIDGTIEFKEAVSCTNKLTKQFCENNTDYNHIL